MPVIANPALAAFIAQLGSDLEVAQVIVRRQGRGYELRHLTDRRADIAELRFVPLSEVRRLAQWTADGAFRPLKSSPDLQQGWRIVAENDDELERALDQLYPGAVADWYAAQSATPPVTHFREFTGRQTGMYRITQKLTDAQAARVIRTGCGRGVCLKRRLWTVAGLAPDSGADKSVIPCLEPCAVLLEFARKAMRIEQEESIHLALAPTDAAFMLTNLRALANPSGVESNGEDIRSPGQLRLLRLLIEKIETRLKPGPSDPRTEVEKPRLSTSPNL